MTFLRKLFGSSPAPEGAPIALVSASVFPGATHHIEVVGEIYHEAALRRVAGPKSENGVGVWKVADLIPEPANKYDKNAVAVQVEGQLVGYIDREHAPAFHVVMKQLGYAGHGLSGAKVNIHGGWKRPDDEGSYIVTVFLPEKIALALGHAPIN